MKRIEMTELLTDVAVAFIRGVAPPMPHRDESLWSKPLQDLSGDEKQTIISLGRTRKLKLHPFKNNGVLPRVSAVIGMIKGISPSRIVDVGSGRGVFLWPLLDSFPLLDIVATDILDYRVQTMFAVARGGYPSLYPCLMDATAMGMCDESADMVTALEVLEHIPDVEKAVGEICRVSSRWIIMSVPSHRDSNPEHIRLLDESMIKRMFKRHGVMDLRFSYVLNHRICLGRK